MRRSSLIPLSVLLIGLAACGKKPVDTGGGAPGGDPVPNAVAPPAVNNSEYLLFAHLKAKDLRDSALFAEVKQAVAKAAGTAEWDQVEGEAGKNIGVKPTDIDAVTVFVTELPPRGEPKFILILAANKPIDKAGAFNLGPQAKPDPRGFYKAGAGLVHFPDDKTVVLLHSELGLKYLDGYAKDRSGWPMSAESTKAAAGHTLFAVVQMKKAPLNELRGPDAKEFAPLLTAQTVTLTADLKGKELSVGVRAAFPDAAAAGQAKDKVQGFIGMATGAVDQFLTGKAAADLGNLVPAVTEAQRALKAARVEVAGSDLTIAASYKADFDFGTMIAEAVKKVREAATRATASNNLKQIGTALHNYHDIHGKAVVHGTGPKGNPLKNAKEKPLLSWRVAMLPFIEQDALYREFNLDEAWDSAQNKKLIEKMPKLFAPNKPGKPGYTHLQMVVGPNAMPLPSASIPASFPDGMSNTIAVVEAADPVIWTKPDDVMLLGAVPKDFKKKFGGLHPNGFNALFWDGSVRFIRDTVSDRTLGLLVDPKDGQVLPSDW